MRNTREGDKLDPPLHQVESTIHGQGVHDYPRRSNAHYPDQEHSGRVPEAPRISTLSGNERIVMTDWQREANYPTVRRRHDSSPNHKGYSRVSNFRARESFEDRTKSSKEINQSSRSCSIIQDDHSHGRDSYGPSRSSIDTVPDHRYKGTHSSSRRRTFHDRSPSREIYYETSPVSVRDIYHEHMPRNEYTSSSDRYHQASLGDNVHRAPSTSREICYNPSLLTNPATSREIYYNPTPLEDSTTSREIYYNSAPIEEVLDASMKLSCQQSYYRDDHRLLGYKESSRYLTTDSVNNSWNFEDNKYASRSPRYRNSRSISPKRYQQIPKRKFSHHNPQISAGQERSRSRDQSKTTNNFRSEHRTSRLKGNSNPYSRKRRYSKSPSTVRKKPRNYGNPIKDGPNNIPTLNSNHHRKSRYTPSTSSGPHRKKESLLSDYTKSSGNSDNSSDIQYPSKLYEIQGKVVLVMDELKCGVLNLEGADQRKANCLFFFKDVHSKELGFQKSFSNIPSVGASFCVNASLMSHSENIPYVATTVWGSDYDIPEFLKAKIFAEPDKQDVKVYHSLVKDISLKLSGPPSVLRKEDDLNIKVDTILFPGDEQEENEDNSTEKGYASSSSIECIKIRVLKKKKQKKRKQKESRKGSNEFNVIEHALEGTIVKYSNNSSGLVFLKNMKDGESGYAYFHFNQVWILQKDSKFQQFRELLPASSLQETFLESQAVKCIVRRIHGYDEKYQVIALWKDGNGIPDFLTDSLLKTELHFQLKSLKCPKKIKAKQSSSCIPKILNEMKGTIKEYFSDEVGVIQLRSAPEVVLFHLNEIWVQLDGWESFKDQQSQMLKTAFPVGISVHLIARQIPCSSSSQLRYQAIAVWSSSCDKTGALQSFREKYGSNKLRNRLSISLENQYNNFKSLARLDLDPWQKEFPFVSVILNGLPEKWTATLHQLVSSSVGIIKVMLPPSLNSNILYALCHIENIYDENGNSLAVLQRSLKSLVNSEVNLIARSICARLVPETLLSFSKEVDKFSQLNKFPLLQAVVVCLKSKADKELHCKIPQPTSLQSHPECFSTKKTGSAYCFISYTLKECLNRKLNEYLQLTKLEDIYLESINLAWVSVNTKDEKMKINSLLKVDTNLSNRIVYGALDESVLWDSRDSSSLVSELKSVYCKPTLLERDGLSSRDGIVQLVLPDTFIKCYAYFDTTCLKLFGKNEASDDQDLADYIPVNSLDLFRGHFTLWNSDHKVPYMTSKIWNENVRLKSNEKIPVSSGKQPDPEQILKLNQLLSSHTDEIEIVEEAIKSKKPMGIKNIEKSALPALSVSELKLTKDPSNLEIVDKPHKENSFLNESNEKPVELESAKTDIVIPRISDIATLQNISGCDDQSVDGKNKPTHSNVSKADPCVDIHKYAETVSSPVTCSISSEIRSRKQSIVSEIKEENLINSSSFHPAHCKEEKVSEFVDEKHSFIHNGIGRVVKVLNADYAVAVMVEDSAILDKCTLVVFDICDLCSDKSCSNLKMSDVVKPGSFVKLNAIRVFDRTDKPYLACAVIIANSIDELETKEITGKLSHIASLDNINQDKIKNFKIVSRFVSNETFSEQEQLIVKQFSSLGKCKKKMSEEVKFDLINKVEHPTISFTELPDDLTNKTGLIMYRTDKAALLKFDMTTNERTVACFAILFNDLFSYPGSKEAIVAGYPVTFHALAMKDSPQHVYIATRAYTYGCQLTKQKFMAEVEHEDWIKNIKISTDFPTRVLCGKEFMKTIDILEFRSPCILRKVSAKIVKTTKDVKSNQNVIILKFEQFGYPSHALFLSQSETEVLENQEVYINAVQLAEKTNLDYLVTALWTEKDLEIPVVEYGYVSCHDVKLFHRSLNHAEEIIFLSVLINEGNSMKEARLQEILGKLTFSKFKALLVAYEEEIRRLIQVEDFDGLKQVKAPFSLNEILTRANCSISEEEVLELLILVSRCYSNLKEPRCLSLISKSCLQHIKEDGIQAVSDALPKLRSEGLSWKIPEEWSDQATTMAWEDIVTPPVDGIPETWGMELDAKLLVGASAHGLLNFNMMENGDLWEELADDPDFLDFNVLISNNKKITRNFLSERLKYMKKLVMFRGRFLENMEINTEFSSCENDDDFYEDINLGSVAELSSAETKYELLENYQYDHQDWTNTKGEVLGDDPMTAESSFKKFEVSTEIKDEN